MIGFDLELYDDSLDVAARARASNLTADLGKVTHLLSDKTGTLTCNEMALDAMAIVSSDLRRGVAVVRRGALESTSSRPRDSDKAVLATAEGVRMLLLLACCNTVIVDHDDESDETVSNSSMPRFNAEGPDEEALVQGAAALGLTLLSRSTDGDLRLSYSGGAAATNRPVVVGFSVLACNAFTSTRKRMSVVIECTNADDLENELPPSIHDALTFGGRRVLLLKGADEVVFSLATGGVSCHFRGGAEEDEAHMMTRLLRAEVDTFAREGLRTLVAAWGDVSEEAWASFTVEREAAASITGAEDRCAALARAAMILEGGLGESDNSFRVRLRLMGATAIEDRLQVGVPETIEALRRAGIIVWILTGDKVQTATSVALASRLLDESMAILDLTKTGSRTDGVLADLSRVSAESRAIVLSKLRYSARAILHRRAHDSQKLAELAKSFVDGKKRHERKKIDPESEVVKHIEEGGQKSMDGVRRCAEISDHLNYDVFSGVFDTLDDGTLASLLLQDDNSGAIRSSLAMVLSGATCTMLLSDEQGDDGSETLLHAVASCCASVLACRVAPSQKALLSKLVTHAPSPKPKPVNAHLARPSLWQRLQRCGRSSARSSPVTLSIGDGANDVPMLQVANVGIGIAGKEGNQAANNADFSFSQFRFLVPLLLGHGRQNYRRVAMLIKVVCFTYLCTLFLLFFFGFESRLSGQSVLVNTYYLTLYPWIVNVLVVGFCWWDRDFARPHAYAHPAVYRLGRLNMELDAASLALLLFRALVTSVLLYGSVILTRAAPDALSIQGGVLFTSLYASMLWHTCWMGRTWTPLISVFLPIMFLFGIASSAIVDTITTSEGCEGDGISTMFSSQSPAIPTSLARWLQVGLALGCVVVIDVAFRAASVEVWPGPSPERVLEEMEHLFTTYGDGAMNEGAESTGASLLSSSQRRLHQLQHAQERWGAGTEPPSLLAGSFGPFESLASRRTSFDVEEVRQPSNSEQRRTDIPGY